MPVSVPRPPLTRRTAVVGAVVVAAAVAVALVAVFTGGSGRAPGVRLTAPVAADDTVPKPHTYTEADVRKFCDVSTATLRRYAPGGHRSDGDPSRCHWTSAKRARLLAVDVERGPAPGPGAVSAAGSAVRALGPETARLAGGRPPRPVTGIGDEAYYTYSAGEKSPTGRGGQLRFRAGNAVVRVSYLERYRSPERPKGMSDSEARTALLAVAADIARAAGIGASPRLGAPVRAGRPPVRRMPRPCDLVPRSLVRRLAPAGHQPASDDSSTDFGGMDFGGPDHYDDEGCTWASGVADVDPAKRSTRRLTVWVRPSRDWRPGVGTWLARRDYLAAYHDAREGPDRSRFQPVRGLGDEAFSVVVHPESSGFDQYGANVAFRYRNVVVLVGYTRIERADPGAAAARAAYTVNAAYTVAARARAALPA